MHGFMIHSSDCNIKRLTWYKNNVKKESYNYLIIKLDNNECFKVEVPCDIKNRCVNDYITTCTVINSTPPYVALERITGFSAKSFWDIVKDLYNEDQEEHGIFVQEVLKKCVLKKDIFPYHKYKKEILTIHEYDIKLLLGSKRYEECIITSGFTRSLEIRYVTKITWCSECIKGVIEYAGLLLGFKDAYRHHFIAVELDSQLTYENKNGTIKLDKYIILERLDENPLTECLFKPNYRQYTFTQDDENNCKQASIDKKEEYMKKKENARIDLNDSLLICSNHMTRKVEDRVKKSKQLHCVYLTNNELPLCKLLDIANEVRTQCPKYHLIRSNCFYFAKNIIMRVACSYVTNNCEKQNICKIIDNENECHKKYQKIECTIC